MNELQIFNNPEFGEIRTITENGKTLFCGSDVARALGYDQPSKAIDRHCRYGTKRTVPHPQSPDKTIEMLFIPESDLYRLAFGSKLPTGEKLTDWVTEEVLPSIRKHGAYMTPDTLDKMITSPEFGIKLLTALKDEQDKRKALEAENEAQRQAIADFEPIKQYVDTILSSTRTLTTTQIAADYNMSAKKLNKILRDEGVQRYVNGQWILYKQYMGKGYTKSKTINITRSDGQHDTVLNTEWTQKGRLLIHEILTARGIQAIMDKQAA